MSPSRAYVTLLSTASYLPGVAALSASLRRTRSRFPLFVMVTHDVDPRTVARAERLASGVIRIPAISNPGPSIMVERWNRNYSKLQMFGLTQFEKIVYLDADMIICANIDDLFERPHFSAASTGELLKQDGAYFNAGLLVVEPNTDQHREMLSLIGPLAKKDHNDQTFLYAYFPDWPKRTELHLDPGLNTLDKELDRYASLFGYRMPTEHEVEAGPDTPDAKVFRVIHFASGRKPWHVSRRVRHLLHYFDLGDPSIRFRATRSWYQLEWGGRVMRRLHDGTSPGLAPVWA